MAEWFGDTALAAIPVRAGAAQLRVLGVSSRFRGARQRRLAGRALQGDRAASCPSQDSPRIAGSDNCDVNPNISYMSPLASAKMPDDRRWLDQSLGDGVYSSIDCLPNISAQLQCGPQSLHDHTPALTLADRAVFAAATSRRCAATNSAGHAFPGPGAMRAAASASLVIPLVLGVAPPTEALLGGPPLCCPSNPSPGISANPQHIESLHLLQTWVISVLQPNEVEPCHQTVQHNGRILTRVPLYMVRMWEGTVSMMILSSWRTDGELRLGLGPLAHAAPRGVLARLTRVMTHHRQSVEPAAGHLQDLAALEGAAHYFGAGAVGAAAAAQLPLSAATPGEHHHGAGGRGGLPQPPLGGRCEHRHVMQAR